MSSEQTVGGKQGVETRRSGKKQTEDGKTNTGFRNEYWHLFTAEALRARRRPKINRSKDALEIKKL